MVYHRKKCNICKKMCDANEPGQKYAQNIKSREEEPIICKSHDNVCDV